MKKIPLLVTLFCSADIAKADDFLTGDTRLACEAIVCLTAPAAPAECASALGRYFGINLSTPSKTFSARTNFLNLCPKVSAQQAESITQSIQDSLIQE